jgi:dihydrofolate synthase / folylpolyglutamate synthase
MNFDEALQYLLSLGHETLAIKLGLRNTELLLDALQNPEQSFPSVQIAGTNGKGSTASFLDSICRAAGIRTGLYTSPHLESITERIKIDGEEISREDFARHLTDIRENAERLVAEGQIDALPTFFEHVTAIALGAFREAKVELAILETGLGGRLDSTTAANAKICGITQIDIDHEEYLGTDLRSIAAEKAAIIRPGSSVVIAHQQPDALEVIRQRCQQVGVEPTVIGERNQISEISPDGKCRVTFETAKSRYEDLWLGLRGHHQVENAAVAIELTEFLKERNFQISRSALVDGLQNAIHHGRLELLDGKPQFLLDGAHNPAGAQMLRSFLNEFARRPLTLVFGAMRDKRVEEIVGILFPSADNIVLTNIQNPRSASLESMLSFAQRYATGPVTTALTSSEAIEQALKLTKPDGMICVTGSLYLIGEVRDRLIQQLAR